ncbi:MAG: hypothetical protein ACRDQB_15310, partial [Thermocrispum sp.]
LLDDPARLADADTSGLLRAAAMSGAQVRSAAESARELELPARLDVGRPRAVVLVGRQGIGRSATRLISTMLAPGCPVPVVLSDAVPSWVGALDVVYAYTSDPGDEELAASLERAARYGSSLVLTAPPDGPVAASVAGKGMVVTPQVSGAAPESFAAAVVAGLLTVSALNLLEVDVDTLADQLDAEAERDHLGHESFVNPAKALALRLAERTPLLWGLDPVASVVAEHAAHTLAADAGVVADASEYRHAVTRGALHRAAVQESSGGDIFADPDDPDAAGGASRLRLLLLAVRADREAGVVRRSALDMFAEAEVLDVADELGTPHAKEPVLASVLALRFELAALYLGLAAGTIGGTNRYSPLQA